MGLFNKKIKQASELSLEETIEVYRKANVDEYYINQLILSKYNEGRNIDDNSKEFWICSHSKCNIKFNTKEEYVSHHGRVHS